MADEDPRSRFAGTREEYDAGSDSNDSKDSKDNSDVNDSNDGQDNNSGVDVRAGKASQQGLKASRKSVQAYVPEEEKENLEDAWRRIKALCNLANVDEPAKNDFYTAALREGYSNLDALTAYLGLSDEYEEYGEILSA